LFAFLSLFIVFVLFFLLYRFLVNKDEYNNHINSFDSLILDVTRLLLLTDQRC